MNRRILVGTASRAGTPPQDAHKGRPYYGRGIRSMARFERVASRTRTSSVRTMDEGWFYLRDGRVWASRTRTSSVRTMDGSWF